MGAYLVLKNANYMMSRLSEKGYSARIVKFEDNERRIWHTVRIGNYSNRELAKRDAEVLISEIGIKAVVLPSNKF